ncbi:hypothetical protein [Kitasatospora sp. NPDC059827]|uniref:hypothetical protein n=1 Tax=Kitasatospora sp. NPDC059827 TaxID=3346964 RepID=UPI003661DBAE
MEAVIIRNACRFARIVFWLLVGLPLLVAAGIAAAPPVGPPLGILAAVAIAAWWDIWAKRCRMATDIWTTSTAVIFLLAYIVCIRIA